ncbi:MAG TPA: hemerythrin domain-containing protein [Dongiaceae bacterium]|nr:hemerythrin domain-containing protein [Dongiaceae bacterium]
MKITEALLAEHLVFHNMLDHIETTTPKLKTLAELKSLAAMLESMLTAHSRTEDELFIGPLEHCFEQLGQRDALIEEHEEMNKHLRRIRKSTRLKDAKSLFLGAVRRSREIFDKEERLVFPMAEQILKAETLAALGQTWMQQRMDTSVCASCDNKVCV